MKKYEAMFLLDPTFAADAANAETEIRRILDRAGTELILLGKWDERKLAYPIKRRKRGCYVLTYFNGDPSRIKDVERDCHLSEHVLRVLITQAEDLSLERMEKIASEAPCAAKPRAVEEGKEQAAADTIPVAATAIPGAEGAVTPEAVVGSEAAVAVAEEPKDSDKPATPDNIDEAE